MCSLGGGGGVDFPGLVRSSFPHLLPDLTRDSISGSSLFLVALRSSASSLLSHSTFAASLPSFPSASSSTPPPPLFASSSQAAVDPYPSHLSVQRSPLDSLGTIPLPSSAPPSFPSQAHTPAVGLAPPPHSPAPPLSVPATAPPPFWPSFSAASSVQGLAGIHGLGAGYPLSSFVPLFPLIQPLLPPLPRLRLRLIGLPLVLTRMTLMTSILLSCTRIIMRILMIVFRMRIILLSTRRHLLYR